LGTTVRGTKISLTRLSSWLYPHPSSTLTLALSQRERGFEEGEGPSE